MCLRIEQRKAAEILSELSPLFPQAPEGTFSTANTGTTNTRGHRRLLARLSAREHALHFPLPQSFLFSSVNTLGLVCKFFVRPH